MYKHFLTQMPPPSLFSELMVAYFFPLTTILPPQNLFLASVVAIITFSSHKTATTISTFEPMRWQLSHPITQNCHLLLCFLAYVVANSSIFSADFQKRKHKRPPIHSPGKHLARRRELTVFHITLQQQRFLLRSYPRRSQDFQVYGLRPYNPYL